tara:strand:- start:667 stop:2841 length:2175 start_codon:yes stop_codon:yes gene_type:complete
MAGVPYYKVIDCCDNSNFTFINLVNDGSGVWVGDGTYQWTLPDTNLPVTGFLLEENKCYTIIFQGSVFNSYDNLPEGNFAAKAGCTDSAGTPCKPCGTTPGDYYLKFINCCDEDDIIFFKGVGINGTISIPGNSSGGSLTGVTQININNYLGVQLFTGNSVDGLSKGSCYTAILGSVTDPASEVDLATYNNLPYPPYDTDFVFVDGDNCKKLDPDGNPICPSCLKHPCYILTECSGIELLVTGPYDAYNNTYVALVGYPGQVWYVQEFTQGPCDNASSSIIIDTETVVGPCACNCYEVTNYAGAINYIDCDGNTQVTYAPAKFCAQSRPQLHGVQGVDYVLSSRGLCEEGLCPELCFMLINCSPELYPSQPAVIYSTLQSLYEYANNNEVVTIEGYAGCWTVAITEEFSECDGCTTDIIVKTTFTDCDSCQGITAYKLQNCEKVYDVIYTMQDLSAYVGRVIKDDCGCWVVEEINYQPPSTTTITPVAEFEGCTACLAKYYALTDCSNPDNIIYTTEDLSGYIDIAIKIKGCDTCFTVAKFEPTLETPIGNTQSVEVDSKHKDCLECLDPTPRCSRVFNNTTEDPKMFPYIDHEGEPQEISVPSGKFSLRLCVKEWTVDREDTFPYIFEYFGDCADGFCIQEFPNNRTVKPGYNTPICTSEKYDKITCKAADIVYKKVLELRYGISNCCPEEDEKWLIKKELIELQALTDPNYKCQDTPASCNC